MATTVFAKKKTNSDGKYYDNKEKELKKINLHICQFKNVPQ